MFFFAFLPHTQNTDESRHLPRNLHELRRAVVRPGQAVLAGRNEGAGRRQVAGVGHGSECKNTFENWDIGGGKKRQMSVAELRCGAWW